ncbi:MAG TPA: biotin--[acetyl-CoA-carboxylase] ligase [Bryobacteraceae bacterium]|nr:biotin--[acetyl-CoA-carboxylase] ligase [Bryobacteraceae bacterium]
MPLDVEKIRLLRPQNQLHYFPTLGSTMTEAARLAALRAPHGTVVLADEQTAGLGRLGRSWYSQAASGIYSTTLLRLPLSPESAPLAALMLGLATADAISRSTNLMCDLRWPNDVLIDERKVAGILAQLVDGYILAGIGINVNQASFPDGLRTPATSVLMKSGGRVHSREDILLHLLPALDAYCSLLIEEGPHSILRAFAAASSYALHRRVRVEESGTEGVTAGLDENGFLLLRLDDGRLERITSGGIRPAAGNGTR